MSIEILCDWGERVQLSFVIWLEKTSHLNHEVFYRASPKERTVLIVERLKDNTEIPLWLQKHWELETGFSFPSGHTMFATCWALLGVGLLLPHRRFLTVIVLCLWAMMVMSSRLFLGMHWPIDIIASVIISVVLCIPATKFVL